MRSKITECRSPCSGQVPVHAPSTRPRPNKGNDLSNLSTFGRELDRARWKWNALSYGAAALLGPIWIYARLLAVYHNVRVVFADFGLI